MSFNPVLSAPNNGFTTTDINNISFNSAAPNVDMEEIFKRYVGDQYKDYRKNMMMKAVLNIIKKQIKFCGIVAK